MHTLRMLGGIGLADSAGAELDALLRQPKSVALLAYLAMPRPGTWHRRDLLLAMFWPELPQARGRTALRSALHLLRRHLDEDTIRTRGDDEVAVDPDRLTTDVGTMLDDVGADEPARALTHYRGELLPGLYITDAPEFERWLDAERARLAALAVRTAMSVVDRHERASDLAAAAAAARRVAELSPDDESATRRWIALLDRTGDRAQAHAVYERFRSRLAEEFATEPAPETVALMDELRARPPSPRVAHGATASSAPLSSPVLARPTVPEARDIPPAQPAPTPARRYGSRIAAVAVASVLVAAVIAVARSRDRVDVADSVADVRPTVRRLVLLPIDDEARDSSQGYVASGIAYGVARRLERLGSLSIRSGARAEWPTSTIVESDPLRTLGGTTMLRVTLARIADSVEVHASIADSATRTVRGLLDRRFAADELPEIESQVATAVMGALHRVGVPFAVRHDDHPVDAQAYRLTTLGYHQLISLGDDAAALGSFVRATELDPSYARAWAGLASVWGLRTGANQLPFDEGYDRTAAAASRALAIDSTQGSALASLAGVTALKARNVEAGMPLLRRAMAYEPSNPEVFVIASFLHRYTHRWDEARDFVRVARRLDPVTLHYATNEAGVELCAGRPEAAERVYRNVLEQNPASNEAREGLVRSLALQRRFDEALDLWRAGVGPATAPELAQALAQARGREGYFAAVHTQGGLRLRAYRRAIAGRPVSQLRMLHFQFQSGDSAAGFATLEAGVRAGAEWTYRLPCFASVDEVRGTPHYAALLAQIGAMPLR